MPSIPIKRISSAAALVQKLVDKVDNGDATLTVAEFKRVNPGWQPQVRGQPRVYKGSLDAETDAVLLAAINRAKTRGDRSTTGIKSGIQEVVDEFKKADADGDGKLSDAEQKKVKSPLGLSLAAFATLHGGDSISDFKLPAVAGVYVPKTPFVMPRGATSMGIVDALVKHFNAFSNDNRVNDATHTPTRFVLGEVEAKGIAAEIAKMPQTTAKGVLAAFAQRIQMNDTTDFKPPRIWIDNAKGIAAFDALAKGLGVKADFQGKPGAPSYNFW